MSIVLLGMQFILPRLRSDTVVDLVLSHAPPRLNSSRNAETACRAAASSTSCSTDPRTIRRCLRLPSASGLAPSELPNIWSSLPLRSDHASVLHRSPFGLLPTCAALGVRQRQNPGTSSTKAESRHKLCSGGDRNRR